MTNAGEKGQPSKYQMQQMIRSLMLCIFLSSQEPPCTRTMTGVYLASHAWLLWRRGRVTLTLSLWDLGPGRA